MTAGPHTVSVELEIAESNPPMGWLRTDGGERRPFGGWLELIGLLEAVLGAGKIGTKEE